MLLGRKLFRKRKRSSFLRGAQCGSNEYQRKCDLPHSWAHQTKQKQKVSMLHTGHPPLRPPPTPVLLDLRCYGGPKRRTIARADRGIWGSSIYGVDRGALIIHIFLWTRWFSNCMRKPSRDTLSLVETGRPYGAQGIGKGREPNGSTRHGDGQSGDWPERG